MYTIELFYFTAYHHLPKPKHGRTRIKGIERPSLYISWYNYPPENNSLGEPGIEPEISPSINDLATEPSDGINYFILEKIAIT